MQCVAAASQQTTTAITNLIKQLSKAAACYILCPTVLVARAANPRPWVAALIGMKSTELRDVEAKLVLADAIEQVMVMARVHRRLRASAGEVSSDSQLFLSELCDDLRQ